MTTNSSILAWRVPWTVDLVGYSLWGSKESDILKQLSTAQHSIKHEGLQRKPMILKYSYQD